MAADQIPDLLTLYASSQPGKPAVVDDRPGAVWDMPTVFIGSVAQIRADLQARRDRFGLSYLITPDRELPALAAVIAGT